jgi:phage minor structural protein
MRRIIVFTPADQLVRELAPSEVLECVRTDEINGEHSLEITTTEVLEREQRILLRDSTGKWREYVVMRCDESHASGDSPTGTYWCPWSLMHDLAVTKVSAMPGTQAPVAASAALADALSGTARWSVGTVTQAATGGASMYFMSGYQALGVLVENWGGELDATIGVDLVNGRVTSRAVDLYAQQGDQSVPRRFDWSRDMRSIRRRVEETPVACRIIPRGKGEQTDAGGYGRKIGIEDVNGGVEWLQDDEVAPLLRMPDGSGGWEYPTVIVENSDIEDPQELKDWGLSVLHDYTRPKVTYDADVLQLAAAGMDASGLALGDAVQCVDRGFSADGLRIGGRVSKVVVNELDDTDVRVTVGYLSNALASKLGGISSAVARLNGEVASLSGTTYEYLNNLLDHINAQINALGGWSYMVPGRGMITYSAEVSDPEVGAEVKAIINAGGEGSVVEVSGGGIRLANSLTSGGDWNWRTLITSGHILADLVTAARLTAGRISSADGLSYWDLDGNDLNVTGRIRNVTDGKRSGSKHYSELGSYSGYDTDGNAITYKGLRVYSNGESYDGSVTLVADGGVGTSGGYPEAQLLAIGRLWLKSFCETRNDKYSYIWLGDDYISASTADTNGTVSLSPTGAYVGGLDFTVNAGDFTVGGGGNKNRLVETDDYGDVLLAAYETATPMFGDVGGGRIGEDGTCVVEIDDVFAETAALGSGYRVFLQACGSGALWVADKQQTHFIVEGEPGLAFDWELKAQQVGCDAQRFERYEMRPRAMVRDEMRAAGDPSDAYSDYVTEMEQLYEQETAA